LSRLFENVLNYGYLLESHSAVGVGVAEPYLNDREPLICLATGKDLAHHEMLDRLVDAPTRCTVLPADEKAVKDFIFQHAPKAL